MSATRPTEWVSTVLRRGLREAGFDRVEEVRFRCGWVAPEHAGYRDALRVEFSRGDGATHALRVPADGPRALELVTWTSLPVDHGSRVRVEGFARLARRLYVHPDARPSPVSGLANSDVDLVARVRALGVLDPLPAPDSSEWTGVSWTDAYDLGLPRWLATSVADVLSLRERSHPDVPAARELLTLLADGVPLGWAARRVLERAS